MHGMQFDGVVIRGIATAAPKKIVYTEDFRDHFENKEVERFIENVGIKARRHSGVKQTASDLCFVASKALLAKYDINDDIDALVFATQTPDYHMPSTAFVIQKRLGLKKDCIAFDINLGCTGFVTSVYIISGMITSGMIKRALLLVGDAKQEHPLTNDHTDSMMYGDAGSAILLEAGKGTIRGMIRSDGDSYKALIAPYPGSRYPVLVNGDICNTVKEVMDGNEVFLFAITKVPRLFNEFYNFFHVDRSNFDYFILHQANLLILKKIVRKLKIEQEKVPISLDRFGNTNGATIPLTICDAFGNCDESKTLHLITAGFGIGLSQGIVSFDINTDDILSVIYSDDYYEEGFSL